MGFIKKTLLGILVLFLTSLIILFTISYDLKKIIVNGIIMEVIKTQVSVINYKEANNNNNNNTEVFKYVTDNEEVNEILESEEIQELVSKYLDLIVNGMIDEESLDEIEIEKDMMNYIRENRSVIEEKVGVTITEEDLQKTESQIQEQEISQNLKEAIKETRKTLTEKQKKTLKGYGLITSLKLRIILLILMIIDSILIIVVQRKDLKFIYVLANSLFSAGICLIVMSIIVKIVILRMTKLPILKLSILLKHGLIELIIGLIVMIIYKLIMKYYKGGIKDEISQTSL